MRCPDVICAQDGRMRLAPPAGDMHTFDANDRLVVISGSKFETNLVAKQ